MKGFDSILTPQILNYFYIFIASIFSGLPIIFVNYYSKNKNIFWIIMAIASYTVLVFSYLYLLLNTSNSVSKLYSLIKISSIVIVVIFSILFLKEKLTIKNIIGLILGSIAISLL
jgi:uncharacterized membrane protein